MGRTLTPKTITSMKGKTSRDVCITSINTVINSIKADLRVGARVIEVVKEAITVRAQVAGGAGVEVLQSAVGIRVKVEGGGRMQAGPGIILRYVDRDKTW